MDGNLHDAMESVKQATEAASAPGRPPHEAVTSALRAALTIRRYTSSIELLIRTFADLTTRRDTTMPSSVEAARAARANVEEVLLRSTSDSRNLQALAEPLVVALLTTNHAAEAVEVREAADAVVALLAKLNTLAHEMIDVMILREAELDPDDDEPAVPLADVIAGLDKVA